MEFAASEVRLTARPPLDPKAERLAQALRSNLRRRKAASAPPAPKPPEIPPDPEA